MNKTFLLTLCLFATTVIMAQKGITPEMLQSFRASYQSTGANKALDNAVAANDIKVLAVNTENLSSFDTYFSNKVKSKGITDQKGSGTCWLHTGLNMLRAKVIAKYDMPSFELSKTYCFFFDQLEKSNLFLQSVIDNADKPMQDRLVEWLFKNPLGDGGQFTGVSDIITKYGVVPESAMHETYSSSHTNTYAMLMKTKLREQGLELRKMVASGAKAKQLEKKKTEMLGVIYKMIVRCFGTPPEKFTYTLKDKSGKPVSTKEYTPKSFYQEFIGKDLENNYVMFMNDPSREYYKTYEIDLDRHVYDGHNWIFLNVPMDDIKQMAIASIKDSTMLYMSCDVNQFNDSKRGYSDPDNFNYGEIMGTTFPMDKKERIMTFASSSTHAMTLMAVDLDENGKAKKWMVENSWGAGSGYQGHIIMSDKWLDEYLFRLVVEKKYIPENLLKLMNQKPTLLPAWDPLFTPED